MVEIELSDDSPYVDGQIFEYDDGTLTLERDATLGIEEAPGDELHTVVFGDTLELLAGKFYGNSKKWHIIARANMDLEDFINLVPGIELRIPNPNVTTI